MKVQFSTFIESVKANKDRTLTLKLETQELPPEETADIFGQMGQQIWCCVASTEIKLDDLEIPEAMTEIGDKTPSQRLRGRMYAYFKETHGGDDTGFHAWYTTALEKIGNSYLEKLD